jgi:hypothetical protein
LPIDVIAAVGGSFVWDLRREKKHSILSKSSTSASRVETCGGILHCLRGCVITTLQRYHTIKLTTRRILVPENMILMGGNTRKINVKAQVSDEQHSRTHRTKTLSEGSREYVEDIHGRSKPLGESLIAFPFLRMIKSVGFPLKNGKNGVSGDTPVDLSSEEMGGKVLAGLLCILF